MAPFALALGLTASLAHGGEPPPLPHLTVGPVTAVLADGRQVIAGGYARPRNAPSSYSFVVERLNADGSPDLSFAGSGFVSAPIWFDYEFVNTVLIQPDGKIVLGGSAADPVGNFFLPECGAPYFCRVYPALVRINSDGTIDRSFNGTGKLILAIGEVNAMDDVPEIGYLTGLTLEADGTLVVKSRTTVIARVRSDGTLDPSFTTVPGLQPREFRNPLIVVRELYNAELDHYFISWIPEELEKLDANDTLKGWVPTGLAFLANGQPGAGTSSVCRFYIPPSDGDSHFFGRGDAECAATAQQHPSFVLEDPSYIHMSLPDGGTCPKNTVPVFRLFNNRTDANHRYTTDRTVRAQMLAKGWLAEGDGPDHVVMCGPIATRTAAH